MDMHNLTNADILLIKNFQKNEITEYYIYKKLSKKIKDKSNSEILNNIAEEEFIHYNFWKQYSKEDVEPNWFKVFWYYFIIRVFGLTFGIKLMESGERNANKNYELFSEKIPEAYKIAKEEDAHEQKLINLLEEDRLNYIGSIVLGLNDALVELTGALAGYTFALQNTKIIALVGFITGIAASMSMAASEYLSSRAENDPNALKSAIYTGIAYILTVIILISPYVFFKNYFLCLVSTILLAIIIIAFFNFYISVAKDLNFKHRFFEMFFISIGVALISFGIGFAIKKIFGVEL